MQLYNVQQKLRDHYCCGSHKHSPTAILTVTTGEVCSRRNCPRLGKLSIIVQANCLVGEASIICCVRLVQLQRTPDGRVCCVARALRHLATCWAQSLTNCSYKWRRHRTTFRLKTSAYNRLKTWWNLLFSSRYSKRATQRNIIFAIMLTSSQ